MTKKKLKDMELDMVADMEVDKVFHKVADMVADIFTTKCIKLECSKTKCIGPSCLMQ